MAFLFKSKKNQDRGLTSRDGPPVAGAARMRDDKGARSTPTGSVNSIDNDGSMGSPDQAYARQRGQSLDQQPQQTPPQLQQQQQAQQHPGEPPVRFPFCVYYSDICLRLRMLRLTLRSGSSAMVLPNQ